MTATGIKFTAELAPCGRVVDGERYQDQDDEALISDLLYYACGCRSIRHEYHDGAICRKVIRHDGRVLEDEFLAGQ